jgi:protein tyrosine phosphatase (PTP) superfamily phosphohydrolase (DUF442 family)/RimJ/RimL family protein N-acetyltransferase
MAHRSRPPRPSHPQAAPRLERLQRTPQQVSALQRVLEGAPDYFHRLTGRGPSPEAAADLLAALPSGKTSDDKYVFGVYLSRELIGCIDLIRRYPTEACAFVGLLFVGESWQRRGFGRAAYDELEAFARGWPECRFLRLAVAETNPPALHFWERLGFRTIAARRSATGGADPLDVRLMEKEVRREMTLSSMSTGVYAASMDALFSEGIPQYRRLSHRLATGGQPDERHLAALAPAGFEVVINLLPADAETALPHEGDIVRSLGMTYVHIPVSWTRPTLAHLKAFCDCLEMHREQTLFVHCAANMRVSVFVALYRILREGWQQDRALREARRVWEPDPVWQRFIARVLGDKADPATGGSATRARRPRLAALARGAGRSAAPGRASSGSRTSTRKRTPAGGPASKRPARRP